MSQPLRQVLPRHRRAFGHGAMTAALAIVPVYSARARTPQRGDVAAPAGPGPRPAGGIHAVPGELPWMVRLSTGGSAETGTAQQSLTAEPWVDSTGDILEPSVAPAPARQSLLAGVPRYRMGSYIF